MTLWLVGLMLLATPQDAPGEVPDEVRRAIRLAFDQRYDEALAIFKDRLADNPEDPLLNYYCGITYLKLDQPNAAIAYLSMATRKEAPFPEAYRWLAEAHLRKGNMEKARQAVEEGWKRFEGNQDLDDLRRSLQRDDGPPNPPDAPGQ